MWEELALRYNEQRHRGWMARDFDSLRRKFKSLYSKTKPSGFNGDLPPKLRVIQYAQEIQVAIDKKGGAHTSHDGNDEGQEDRLLLLEVDAALGVTSDMEDEGDSEVDQNGGINEDESSTPREDQNTSDGGGDIGSQQQQSPDLQTVSESTHAVGSVVTSRGVYDAVFADEVWFDEEEPEEKQPSHIGVAQNEIEAGPDGPSEEDSVVKRTQTLDTFRSSEYGLYNYFGISNPGRGLSKPRVLQGKNRLLCLSTDYL